MQMYKYSLEVLFYVFFSNENNDHIHVFCDCDGRSTFLDKALSNACIYQKHLLHNILQF